MDYCCFIKAKAGELKAIRYVKDKQLFTPFFDMPALKGSKTPAALYKQLTRSLKYIAANWPKGELFFVDHFDIDLGAVMPDSTHPYLMLKSLLDDGFNLGLVTGLDRDENYNAAVFEIASQYNNNVAIRLLVDDIYTPSISIVELKGMLASLSKCAKKIIIVLDLRVIVNKDPAVLAAQCIKFISRLENEGISLQVVITSSSFPANLTSIVPTGSSIRIDRTEETVWDEIDEQYSGDLELVYGDYATVSPDFIDVEFQGPPPIAPKVVYTTNGSYVVMRGKSVIHHPDGFKQFIKLAQEATSLPEYRGKEYSYGDGYIAKIAGGDSGSGNATTWITCAVNQHIEYVSR